MKKIFLVLLCIGFIISCGNDDNGIGGTQVPPRLLSEVATENDEEIREFLSTHFYNYEEFQNPPEGFDYKIIIDTIAGDNASKTPLLQQVKDTIINVSSNEFLGLESENDVPHTFYYLDVRTGAGDGTTIADSTYVRYQGLTLDLDSFDGSTEIPIWFDLARLHAPQTGLGGKSFRGFAIGAAKLKAGNEVVSNPDGTFDVQNYGIGLIIFPSGLGNYNNLGIFPAYSPLIFKIDLYAVNQADHDGDGIPSIFEDIDSNDFLYDDNTDRSLEEDLNSTFFADFLDLDDDGDGVLTRTEISDADGNVIIPYPDTDNDGTPDYLDVNILRDPNE